MHSSSQPISFLYNVDIPYSSSTMNSNILNRNYVDNQEQCNIYKYNLNKCHMTFHLLFLKSTISSYLLSTPPLFSLYLFYCWSHHSHSHSHHLSGPSYNSDSQPTWTQSLIMVWPYFDELDLFYHYSLFLSFHSS